MNACFLNMCKCIINIRKNMNHIMRERARTYKQRCLHVYYYGYRTYYASNENK